MLDYLFFMKHANNILKPLKIYLYVLRHTNKAFRLFRLNFHELLSIPAYRKTGFFEGKITFIFSFSQETGNINSNQLLHCIYGHKLLYY